MVFKVWLWYLLLYTKPACETQKFLFKIWDRATGKPYTSIESENAELNDICAYEGSGLIFMANEQPKMQVHYIPSLG